MLQTQTLSSGLRLLTIPIKEVPSVSVLVLINAGSRYETEQTNGLAHFTEHMLFQGNQKWPTKLDLGIAVDQVGAEFNGMTGKEYTGYYVKTESKHLDLGLDILSQMLWHSKFETAQIEREKGVIDQEISYREDTPQISVSDMMMEMVFGGSSLGLSGAGEKETIKKFQREDFLHFHKNYYHSQNTIIAIAGNFKQNEAEEKVKHFFGSLPSGQTIKPQTFPLVRRSPAQPGEGGNLPNNPKFPNFQGLQIKAKTTDQAHFCLGTISFKKSDPRRYQLALLNTILGSGMSSRLFQKVREEKSLAYYIDSDIDSYQDTGIFTVSAGVAPEKISEAISTIIEELDKLTKIEAVKKTELRKAKDYLRGRLALSLEESLEQAMFYGISWLLEGKIRTVEEILNEVEKVTPDEITDVAKAVFKKENYNLAVVGKDVDRDRLEKLF